MTDDIAGSSPTPQCDALAARADERDTVNEFLDWLWSQGMFVAKINNECGETRCMSVRESNDSLALSYLGIDGALLEQERRAMLKDLR